MKLTRLLSIAFVLLLLAAAPVSVASDQSPRPAGVIIVKSGEVQWVDYPNRPGVKLALIEGDLSKPGPFVMRVKFPAGFKLAPHTHPNVEHTTILSGAMRLGYGTNDAGPAELLPAGTILITPANTPHFASTPQETIVQTHGIGPWASTPVK